MKRLLLPLLIAVATTVFVGGVWLWLLRIPAFRSSVVGRVSEKVLSTIQYTLAPDSFRQKIYLAGESQTPYPGSGEVRVEKPERLLVIAQAEGGEIKEAPLEEFNLYLARGYQAQRLSANDQYVLYTVGRFQRFEEIEAVEEVDGGGDRLLVLVDPFDVAKLYTYHIVRTALEVGVREADVVPTQFGVEKLSVFSGANTVENLGVASELSNEALDTLFRVGDTVVVTPVPPYPGLATTDANDFPYANVVTVRRARVPRL